MEIFQPSTVAGDAFVPPDSAGEWFKATSLIMNTTTVGNLVLILRTVARNAGISDSDDTTYDLTTKHLAIQQLLKDFIRRTKCVSSVDTFTITPSVADVDLSTVIGISTERIRAIWLDTETRPVDIVSIDEIAMQSAYSGSDGCPRQIGFSDTTGIGKLWPIPSSTWTGNGNVRWWPALVDWTLGGTDPSVGETVINMPGDLAEQAVYAGGIWYLQKNQPEHNAIAAQSKTEYEALVQRSMGTGGLGVQVITRSRQRFYNPADSPYYNGP